MLFALSSAFAEESSFAGTDAAGQVAQKPTSRLAASLGGAFTAGNTSTYTLNGGVDGDHRWGRNKLGVNAGVNLGQSVLDANGDGRLDDAERDAGWAETARKVGIDARYDRYVGRKGSLYVLAGTLADPFAGYDNRSHVQVGYSRVLHASERTSLLGELGADAAREDFVDGIEPGEAYVFAARAMLGLTHDFNASVRFEDRLEVYESIPNFADLRVANQAALTSKLSDTFALKLTHVLAYDNEPVEGFQPLDHTTSVTFVASLL